MFQFARLVVVGFIFLTIVYVILSIWSRSVRRRKLAAWWEEEGRPGERDDYVEKGLAEYDRSLRRKLILGVYIIPVFIVSVIIYVTNFY